MDTSNPTTEVADAAGMRADGHAVTESYEINAAVAIPNKMLETSCFDSRALEEVPLAGSDTEFEPATCDRANQSLNNNDCRLTGAVIHHLSSGEAFPSGKTFWRKVAKTYSQRPLRGITKQLATRYEQVREKAIMKYGTGADERGKFPGTYVKRSERTVVDDLSRHFKKIDIEKAGNKQQQRLLSRHSRLIQIVIDQIQSEEMFNNAYDFWGRAAQLLYERPKKTGWTRIRNLYDRMLRDTAIREYGQIADERGRYPWQIQENVAKLTTETRMDIDFNDLTQSMPSNAETLTPVGQQLTETVINTLSQAKSGQAVFEDEVAFWNTVAAAMGYGGDRAGLRTKKQYGRIQATAIAIYGETADERGRFKQAIFPKKGRTVEQEEQRREKLMRLRAQASARLAEIGGSGQAKPKGRDRNRKRQRQMKRIQEFGMSVDTLDPTDATAECIEGTAHGDGAEIDMVM
ncbi:hypothetical protein Slin15195_G037920 [Septoria linicola]|uniref:Uncharacterized protein n=1 Tax=Septoria linicola TaxID=215465 RepID=A0A9Q9AQQ6_9PEZI|nr:hypothetical protein Slin14017_G119320 [Septoria linicola]USW50473.1 hypothetical protein Slin15195_G037920 [Septoria linicola]